MQIRKPILALVALVLVAALAFASVHYWRTHNNSSPANILFYLPRNPAALISIDAATLRQSSFLAQLLAWAPQPQKDPDYAKFLQDTGFDFERDLNHLVILAEKSSRPSSDPSVIYFIADGKLDRKKISAYALRAGTQQTVNGHQIFRVPLGKGERDLFFAFLSDQRVMLSNAGAAQAGNLLAEILPGAHAENSTERREWQTRVDRLAGSPIYAVIRRDAVSFADKVPGGFRSPQLASLLTQLEWITIAGKPDGDQLRVVAEGESTSENTTRQLADLLNGILIFAQAGLNDPKLRQQLDPTIRQAYLDLLNSAAVSQLNRNQTKSTRLVLTITPALLEAASAHPQTPPPKSSHP